MRRLILCALVFVAASAAGAGSSHFLDRNGVLWNAFSQSDGMHVVGEKDGVTLFDSTIPFDATAYGAGETGISIAADELTGKVAVVWQRNWSPAYSEVMLAIMKDGVWQSVTPLPSDFHIYPRYPSIQLSRVTTTVADPLAPTDPYRTTVVDDSFLHIAWWTGYGPAQHGVYTLVRLTAGPDDTDALTTRNLDDLMSGWATCMYGPPAEIVERPLFAARPVSDRAYLFHGSRGSCLFQLLEITFRVEDPSAGGTIVTAQRKRHTPVFGVRKLYGVPDNINLEGARVVVGENLNPVAYRVSGPTVEYISSNGIRWSPKRSLRVGGDLTLDQAIPLIEQLAR